MPNPDLKMLREPIVAGQFYEGNADALTGQIRECFTSSFGPGSLPTRKSEKILKGAIVPHAGYFFSGAGAAHVYKAIAESKKPDLFLILGPNHTGLGHTSVLLEDFRTPLGIAKVDMDFGEKLLENTKIDNNPSVHKHEHSIEVQLPFLQFIYKNDFMFVPVSIASPVYLDELAAGIRKTIRQTKKNVCVIASSDFTHYGFNYSFVPFQDDVRKKIEELDMGAIEKIKEMKPKEFMHYVGKTGATICGYLPIFVMLDVLRKGKVELLKYYTSGDVVHDHNTSVSYASIVVY